MGDFDVDLSGNKIIVHQQDGTKVDRQGRRVNDKGYLIDSEGNIITQVGIVIFKKSEVCGDGEIPAPYSIEKRKKHLLTAQGGSFEVDEDAIIAGGHQSVTKRPGELIDEAVVDEKMVRLQGKEDDEETPEPSVTGEKPGDMMQDADMQANISYDEGKV